MRQRAVKGIVAGGLWLVISLVAGPPAQANVATRAQRNFDPVYAGRWMGNAICYGPHRDGQWPGGPSPTATEIREDLHLMREHWQLMRLYGAGGVAETILQTIRTDSLGMKVMIGAWIAPESPGANDREVAAAVRLANAYPEVVVAVIVGNETQVSWSAHRSPLADLIETVKRVRPVVSVPVTVSDDFSFWVLPESQKLSAELDFVMVNAHPLWNGRQLDEALPWLEARLAEIRHNHPGQVVVLGETGWATAVSDHGEQATLIKGATGESEQKIFYDQIREWASANRTTTFFFEAFDENWKGGDDPVEVEKHWGLFRADRSAKQALTDRP